MRVGLPLQVGLSLRLGLALQFGLPLCFGLVWYGIVFSGLNALVLWIRIRAEAAALRQ